MAALYVFRPCPGTCLLNYWHKSGLKTGHTDAIFSKWKVIQISNVHIHILHNTGIHCSPHCSMHCSFHQGNNVLDVWCSIWHTSLKACFKCIRALNATEKGDIKHQKYLSTFKNSLILKCHTSLSIHLNGLVLHYFTAPDSFQPCKKGLRFFIACSSGCIVNVRFIKHTVFLCLKEKKSSLLLRSK